MWHDTMLAGCRPVWDFSSSHITLKTQSIASLNCCSKHKLKISRPRAVPGIVQGSNSSRNDYCDWRSKELRQLSQQRRSSLVSFKSRAKRSPYFCRGVALGFKTLSILTQESRPIVKVSGSTSSSLAVSLTALATKNDVEDLGLNKSDMGMQGQRHRTQKHEGNLGDREILRRRRISLANKGKVPWNKGCKHSPETIKRIKEKTSQAMRSPTVTTSRTDFSVLAKLRRNARHPQSDETKVKIRDKLRVRWGTKKRIRGYQDLMLKDWRHSLADAARRGGLWEEEMAWNSYSVIKKKMRVEAVAVAKADNARKKGKGTPRRTGKSREHRQKISDAIKAKWEDPNYQSKVREGMTKNSSSANPRKRVVKRKSAGNRVAPTGVIKEPLDHGFLTAVMSGEKKKQQRERAAKDLDDDCLSVSASNAKSRAGYRKVDLLKKHSVPAQFVNEDFPQVEETSSEELSVSAAHSFVDPQANEKISKLKLLQASRSVMDKKRQEATQRAKLLMAEAERAVAVLEAAAGTNDSALQSLAEIHRLMAEAAQFIQAADSVNEAYDENKFGTGVLQEGTMSLHQSSKSHLQITSHGKHVSIYREDGKVMSSSDSEATHDHDQYLQPGHEITAGMKTSSTTTLDSAETMLFRNEVREMAMWDAHHPFTEEPTSKSKVPSILGLLNGRPSRSIGALKETESKALFGRWQPTRLGFRGDGCMGCTPSIHRRTDKLDQGS